jgi:hypothetical protein
MTTVGISENQAPSALVDTWALYPNPAHESLTLSSKEALEVGTIVSIYDATGALVKQERITSRASNLYIYLGDLSVGLYTCSLTLNKKYFKPISFIKQ